MCFLFGLVYKRLVYFGRGRMHFYYYYYDEVKHELPVDGNPSVQPSYWLGGICVPPSAIFDIEVEVNDIIHSLFGTTLLIKQTELHGVDIIQGHGNFGGMHFDVRCEWLRKILSVIARDDIFRVHVRVNPSGTEYDTTPKKVREKAFSLLMEQADNLFSENNAYGMLIGDHEDSSYVLQSVVSLSKHREEKVGRIVDTAHFVKSDHSRLVQLADIYLYCMQFVYRGSDVPWRKGIIEIIEASGIMGDCRESVWPLDSGSP